MILTGAGDFRCLVSCSALLAEPREMKSSPRLAADLICHGLLMAGYHYLNGV
jgi:hypothetical protein